MKASRTQHMVLYPLGTHRMNMLGISEMISLHPLTVLRTTGIELDASNTINADIFEDGVYTKMLSPSESQLGK